MSERTSLTLFLQHWSKSFQDQTIPRLQNMNAIHEEFGSRADGS